MERYSGGCHCGAVRYTLDGPPTQRVYCHCSNCRLSTGSAFAMIGMWAPDKVTWSSAGELVGRATSSYLTRFRCADCGAAVYNRVRSDRGSSDNFLLPLLDAIDDAARPTHHIYADTRVVEMEDGLPRFDGFKWMK